MTRQRRGAWRRLALLAVMAWAIGVAWGSLTPGAEMPRYLPWDKFNHVVGYAGLTLWLGLAVRRWAWARAWMIALVFGIVIEYLQLWVPGRAGGDWEDILANALGATVAALLGARIRRCRRRRAAAASTGAP
ncbi:MULTISPECIES: VanZ family protein [Salinicola]|uniref:VanZ family protein n=1 Tax=Salinicola TaxID=404432 RepID=UPI000DA15C4F|nr:MULTISPECIES: VanZ family protein [Salinicola]